MRTDAQLARESFRYSRQWETDPFSGETRPHIDRRLNSQTTVDGRLIVHSLSGHERNHLFLNRNGKDFLDVSSISGIDNPADSRTFVVLDYDRDGWQDIALVNANTPLLNLYRNLISDNAIADKTTADGMIALRFVGGNQSSSPSNTMACRDGYGAMVTVQLDDMSLKREHRCGDGYGAQNSATMIVGVGQYTTAKTVSVRWPSGTVQQVDDVPAGTLLTVYEDPWQSPNGSEFVSETYQRSVVSARHSDVASWTAGSLPRLELPVARSIPEADGTDSRLRMYTTMATWCEACKRHIPQVAHLRSSLGENELEIVGVPIDAEDDDAKLMAYHAASRPEYRLLLGLTDEQRASVEQLLVESTGDKALPSTIVTDDAGNVLLAVAGIPTVSELEKLLTTMPQRASTERRGGG